MRRIRNGTLHFCIFDTKENFICFPFEKKTINIVFEKKKLLLPLLTLSLSMALLLLLLLLLTLLLSLLLFYLFSFCHRQSNKK